MARSLMDFNPGKLMLGLNRETSPQRSAHWHSDTPEAYSNLKSVQLPFGDLCAVLIWQLTLEFNCALCHGDIFLPTSQPSSGFVSQGIKQVAFLSLLQHF